MVAANPIDKKIIQHLDSLNAKQKKAVLSVIKTFVEEPPYYDKWQDASFIKEMDKRIKDYESGKTKGYSWEEVKKHAEKSLKHSKIK